MTGFENGLTNFSLGSIVETAQQNIKEILGILSLNPNSDLKTLAFL